MSAMRSSSPPRAVRKLDVADVFKDDALTVGFARRFATYKRPDFLLHDPERLIRLLTDPQRPVQLVMAGKAHPQDLPGQALIKKWNDFIKRPEVRGHVVFLSDYDMQMAQELVQGMDLWINTPRRPWEACGTSGMKVLANGGLNLSELDGWWAEAYSRRSAGPSATARSMGKTRHGTPRRPKRCTRCWRRRWFRSFMSATRKACR